VRCRDVNGEGGSPLEHRRPNTTSSADVAGPIDAEGIYSTTHPGCHRDTGGGFSNDRVPGLAEQRTGLVGFYRGGRRAGGWSLRRVLASPGWWCVDMQSYCLFCTGLPSVGAVAGVPDCISCGQFVGFVRDEVLDAT
jgi:hypothetical protein